MCGNTKMCHVTEGYANTCVYEWDASAYSDVRHENWTDEYAVGGIRTPDALLRTEALYPLSYDGKKPLLRR